jgi:small GTP-binding protein
MTDFVVRVVVAGDSGAGKTCLVTRFATDAFDAGYAPTIGVDFAIRTLDVELAPGQNRSIRVKAWDCAGQQRFLPICRSYFRGADAVLLVYDAASVDSFLALEAWLQAARADSATDVYAVVATKTDLPAAVAADDGREWARQRGLPFFEASAKTGAGAFGPFVHAARAVAKCAFQNEKPRPLEIAQSPGPARRFPRQCCGV